MKNQLFVFAFLFFPLTAIAQVNICEYDLIGKWGLKSYEGEFNYKPVNNVYNITRPDSIIFFSDEDITRYVGQLKAEDSNQLSGFWTANFWDFFISYGPSPILHFRTSESSTLNLRYRIIRYNYDEIEFQTFDGKGSLVYKRESNPTSVKRSGAMVEYGEKEIYSLQGYKVSKDSQKGINIVRSQNGNFQKTVR